MVDFEACAAPELDGVRTESHHTGEPTSLGYPPVCGEIACNSWVGEKDCREEAGF